VYRRRRPEQTVLHRLVREHLEAFLALTRERDPDGDPVPAYAERALRRYIECGLACFGVARARCGRCGHDFFIPFSCKRRGVCPSCNARWMAEAAAHLVQQVIPKVPVRQWVFSFPKRVRYFLDQDPRLLRRVVALCLRRVERVLREILGAGPAGGRIGAVAIPQSFGSTLNRNPHLHTLVADGLFALEQDGEVTFQEAAIAGAQVRRVEEAVCRGTLRLLVRRGCLEAEDAARMEQWARPAFSVHAGVRIAQDDRAGLERLARYCLRPPFSLERLALVGDRVVYRLGKPTPDGRTQLSMNPEEFLARLVALLPRPRSHRLTYFGVLAPHAALRAHVVAQAREPEPPPGPESRALPPSPAEPLASRSRRRFTWASLIARIYQDDPLRCTRCGGPMSIIAFITEPSSLQPILKHLGEPSRPPPFAPARAPPPVEPLASE
jgi:DNA-directed RNA polymerase subunit RPC12/RpoP